MAQGKSIYDADGKLAMHLLTEGKPESECPKSSDDGKCPDCKVEVEGIYGLGSGYGGIGVYNYCPECGVAYDYTEDRSE